MKPWIGLPLAVVFAFAADAGAQLHKCKDKTGRTVYQDTSCEEGTAAGEVKAPTGSVPAGNLDELGLWESTIVIRPRQKTYTMEELDALGMSGFFLGRPMKTVTCDENPVKPLFLDGSCKNQVATRGGTCRREELKNEGSSKLKVVQTITGDFRARVRMEQTMTRTYSYDPNATQVDESSVEYRFLGPCKPGMKRFASFYVKDNGDWVTEAQMKEELDGKLRNPRKRP